MRNFADTGKRNPLRDHEQILRVENLIMYVTFGDDRLMGLGVARCRISHFSIDLRRRPYNTLALPCECVISTDTRTTVRVCDIHRRISEKDDPSRHAFQGHSRLSEPTRIDPPPMTSYKRSTATTDQFRTVS